MKCGLKTEVYSRVVGYMRPIKQWNKGKKAEFIDRLTFTTPTKEESDNHAQDSQDSQR